MSPVSPGYGCCWAGGVGSLSVMARHYPPTPQPCPAGAARCVAAAKEPTCLASPPHLVRSAVAVVLGRFAEVVGVVVDDFQAPVAVGADRSRLIHRPRVVAVRWR